MVPVRRSNRIRSNTLSVESSSPHQRAETLAANEDKPLANGTPPRTPNSVAHLTDSQPSLPSSIAESNEHTVNGAPPWNSSEKAGVA